MDDHLSGLGDRDRYPAIIGRGIRCPLATTTDAMPAITNGLLFSTRQSLGPVQWGETKYTCFTCQTFLSVAKSVDRNSWKHWLANNTDTIGRNPVLRQLATSITDKLDATTGMMPLELTFESIECPTCNSGRLSTVPFGEHNMRCSKCGDYSGGIHQH